MKAFIVTLTKENGAIEEEIFKTFNEALMKARELETKINGWDCTTITEINY